MPTSTMRPPATSIARSYMLRWLRTTMNCVAAIGDVGQAVDPRRIEACETRGGAQQHAGGRA